MQELNERNWRSRNIVMIGIQEHNSTDLNERRTYDKSQALNKINLVLGNCPSPLKTVRLGKYNPDKDRPLKVCFESAETAKLVLRNKNVLKDDTVKIYSDQTPNQKEHMIKLREELQQRTAKGLFAGQPHWLEPNAGHENMHVVIIDAGSSGSRVLAYTFKVTSKGTTNVELIDEYYQQTEPGLSSYVDQPDKGADSIVQLIHSANTTISAAKRKNTPLIVRATAGLRLLPKDKAEKLIDYVSKAISELGYNVRNNSVEIMDGSDEGIYIWYTINFLHKLIGGETMAALDLGGGSTQITYQLSEEDTKSYPTIDQHVLSTGTNVTVYTHSYLNLGLHAARYGILQLEAGNDSTDKFASVCVHPLVRNASWKYANKQFIISGSPRQGDSENVEIFSRCHAVVKRYVMATLDWEPRQPPRGRVAAMSYFFDVAADAGMIDKLEGGTVSVSQYRARALAACSVSDAEHPWACVDLVFIVTLLQDVYKIQDQDPISLFRQVNGHEVSWALGLAYSTITKVAATESAAMV